MAYDERLDEFAEKLVGIVRDRAIRSCRVCARETACGITADRWKTAFSQMPLDRVIEVVATDVVDTVLFQLLNAIDNGEIRLTYTSEAGEPLDLERTGEGESAGWYLMVPDGWRSRFSEFPVPDEP